MTITLHLTEAEYAVLHYALRRVAYGRGVEKANMETAKSVLFQLDHCAATGTRSK